MIDLKPYMDAVNSAADKVQSIASEIDVLFTEGTDESKIKALELQPSLEGAQAEHERQLALYESMQKATRPNDIARNFVPVSTAQAETDGSQPTLIKRPEYNRMDLVQRALFIKSGGTVED